MYRGARLSRAVNLAIFLPWLDDASATPKRYPKVPKRENFHVKVVKRDPV